MSNPSWGEEEMPFWSPITPHPPLQSISVTEADTGGGPEADTGGGARWCVFHLFCRCAAVIYSPHRQWQRRGPLDESFCFRSLKGREEAKRQGASGRQKQMSLLGYHLSSRGRTLYSCRVYVCVLCWRGCVAPIARDRKQRFDISISLVLAWERGHGSF